MPTNTLLKRRESSFSLRINTALLTIQLAKTVRMSGELKLYARVKPNSSSILVSKLLAPSKTLWSSPKSRLCLSVPKLFIKISAQIKLISLDKNGWSRDRLTSFPKMKLKLLKWERLNRSLKTKVFMSEIFGTVKSSSWRDHRLTCWRNMKNSGTKLSQLRLSHSCNWINLV